MLKQPHKTISLGAVNTICSKSSIHSSKHVVGGSRRLPTSGQDVQAATMRRPSAPVTLWEVDADGCFSGVQA